MTRSDFSAQSPFPPKCSCKTITTATSRSMDRLSWQPRRTEHHQPTMVHWTTRKHRPVHLRSSLLLRCIRESLRRCSLSPHNMANRFNYNPRLLQDSPGTDEEVNHSKARVDDHGSRHPLPSLCPCPTPPATPNPRHSVDRLPVRS